MKIFRVCFKYIVDLLFNLIRIKKYPKYFNVEEYIKELGYIYIVNTLKCKVLYRNGIEIKIKYSDNIFEIYSCEKKYISLNFIPNSRLFLDILLSKMEYNIKNKM